MVIINDFSKLLKEFNDLVENAPPIEKVKDALLELKNKALTFDLNIRQQAAIIERVDNYLNGTYGNTKRVEHMGHEKPTKKDAK